MTRAVRVLPALLVLAATASLADAVPLSLRTLALEEEKMPEWYVEVADGRFEKLTWPTSQPSAPLAAQAGRELILFAMAKQGDSEPQFQPARRVAVPEPGEELLLIATSGKGAGEEQAELKLTAVADKLRNATFSDWLVVNLGEQQVRLRYGEGAEPIELEAGESGIYRVKAVTDKGGATLAEAMRRGEMKPIYSTFWSAPAGQRSLVLFYGEDGRTKLRRIIDFLPASAAAE